MRTNRRYVVFIFLYLVLITLPFILGYINSGNEYIFTGLLFNPIDGNSYFSKMYQGFEGNWKFVLPYSAEPGDGAYLFIFYIFLGHVSRIINISIPLVFHITRVIFTFTMCLSLIKLLNLVKFCSENIKFVTFIFILLGSGSGWLFTIFNEFLPDLWLAEAYPFLSSYANPHFPLGITLFVNIINRFISSYKKGVYLELLIFSFLLSVIIPFALVTVFFVVSLFQIYEWIESNSVRLKYLIYMLIGGIPYSVYQLIIIKSHPQLSKWNEQNITPSPELINMLLALMPVVILALIGVYKIIKNKDKKMIYMILWFFGSLVFMYIPIGLQRRFSVGIFIPITIIAMYTIISISKNNSVLMGLILLFMSVPTNLVIIMTGVYAIQTHDKNVYIEKNEYNVISWLNQNIDDKEQVVLAPIETSLFIPSNTGLRVVYGHPFETINSDINKKFVQDFYDESLDLNTGNWDILYDNIDIIILDEDIYQNKKFMFDNFSFIYENENKIILSNDKK